jgi:hypothetical protein
MPVKNQRSRLMAAVGAVIVDMRLSLEAGGRIAVKGSVRHARVRAGPRRGR